MSLIYWPPFYDLAHIYQMSECARTVFGAYDIECFQQGLSQFGQSMPISNHDQPRLPPWSLWMVYLFGLLSFRELVVFITTISAISLCFIAIILNQKFPTKYILLWCLFFFPTLKTLYFGQISLVIFSCILFALFGNAKYFFRGFLFSMSILRPQLLAGLILTTLFSKEEKFSIKFRLGFILGVGVQFLMSYWFSPNSFDLFMQKGFSWGATEIIATSNLSSLVDKQLNYSYCKWPIFFLVLASCLFYQRKLNFSDRVLLWCLPLGILGSPYNWSHDFIFLLPAWVSILQSKETVVKMNVTIVLLLTGYFSVLIFPYYEQFYILLMLPIIFYNFESLYRQRK